MNLWIRARRVPAVVAAVVLTIAVLHVGRGHVLLMPTVLGGGGTALFWSTFAPLVWGAVLCTVYAHVGHPVELRPGRNLPRLDVGLYCCGNAAFVLALVSVDNRGGWQETLSHTLILGGLAVAVTTRWGEGIGIMTVTGVVLVTLSYGARQPAVEYVAFLQPESDPVFTTVLAVLLTAAAIGALLSRSRGRGRIDD